MTISSAANPIVIGLGIFHQVLDTKYCSGDNGQFRCVLDGDAPVLEGFIRIDLDALSMLYQWCSILPRAMADANGDFY